MSAVSSYYRYDFASAREALRGDAMLRSDEQTILNNTRLGIASLADGDLHEAELALGKSFELLSTAGLNKDRTVAAVLVHEGVRIWKGEPFEQALTYHYVATLYALKNDWENARAAAANALFRLTDFGGDQSQERLARRAAQDPAYLERGYEAVDTNFALGFLMQAIASDLSGAPGAADLLEDAVKVNPAIKPLAEAIGQRRYDTLLIVDYGKGPTKIAYGPDGALSRFQPQERVRGPLIVSSGGQMIARADAACDVNQMAADHRWNNLEDVRRAKSVIGDVLVFGGTVAAMHGADRRDEAAFFGGVGAIVAGLLSKSGAKADTRYCEFMPQSIFVVPLLLESRSDLRVSVQGDAGSLLVLDDVEPGSTSEPRAIYLRIHGLDGPDPDWLHRRKALYGNDHAGVRPGDYPWILGGQDVSTPDRRTLQAYQANGYLEGFSVGDLVGLYDAEGILIGSGMENRPEAMRNPSFRHILEGGTGLFTPHPNSMGYKRLMCGRYPPYRPKSELVRNLSAAIRVKQDATGRAPTRFEENSP